MTDQTGGTVHAFRTRRPQRRRQITSNKNTTSSPATDIAIATVAGGTISAAMITADGQCALSRCRAGRDREMTKLEYPVVIEPLPPEEGGGFVARVPDLPGCTSDG